MGHENGGHENGGWMNDDQRAAMQDAAAPRCGKCGRAMTPKDSRIHPEFFLHDACLPDELKPQPEPMAVASHGPDAPKTTDEARFFHDGFLAGVTAYAGAVGHSQLKSDNPNLRELFDAQGWRTIETYEKLSEAVLVCEHGVSDGEWCESCNKEMKRAEREQLEGWNVSAGFCGGLGGQSDNVAQPLTCANCTEISTNPGQFLRDGRWVCTAACRNAICDKQSYDDLAASGGLVDAP